MSEQRLLDFADVVGDGIPASVMPDVPDYVGLSTAERFEAFHAANPHVYRLLVGMARKMRAAGFRRCGMKALFEQLRWLWRVQTLGESSGYCLNNNFTAYYARLIAANEPDLADFFETRESPARRRA